MAQGLERDEIAKRLYLSVNTVRTHTQKILGKLGVHSTLAAVALVRGTDRTDGRARSSGSADDVVNLILAPDPPRRHGT
jgi:hypothetical protein